MSQIVRAFLIRCLRFLLRPRLDPKQELIKANAELASWRRALAGMPIEEGAQFLRFASVAREMIEARCMAGPGPGFGPPAPTLLREGDAAVLRIIERALDGGKPIEVQEGGENISGQGAFGDIELALANVEWRREINLSWLEFSRWGIQQIILISRLYYIKNPLMRRAIDVSAAYVFGRGVEVTTTDEKANDVLNAFFERNKATLGPTALLDLDRRKYYDGNLFFAFFADGENTGEVNVRSIDTTEVQEIISHPEDDVREILFKRVWRQKKFDASTGASPYVQQTCWYPALHFKKEDGLALGIGDMIKTDPIIWNVPVYHRICGAVAKWSFGCPIAYPAIEWAKTSREFLEACLTLAQSHAQFGWNLKTKGGQAALMGAKAQLQTTVNAAPSNSLWDQNPTAVDGSIFASGPGTTLEPMSVRGKGLDPSEVKEFRNMIGMVFGIPPTWLGDMDTANLSTATTLDRPTELGFRSKQVQWEEDLSVIAQYVLETDASAVSGQLREAHKEKTPKIVRMRRIMDKRGRLVYEAAPKPKPDEIQVRVTFPEIREGDLPELIKAVVDAMTLENKGGQIVGIDEREGVRKLYELLGFEDPEDILDEQYPLEGADKYDPNRTKEPEPAPIAKIAPNPGGQPQLPGGKQPAPQQAKEGTPAQRIAAWILERKTHRQKT